MSAGSCCAWFGAGAAGLGSLRKSGGLWGCESGLELPGRAAEEVVREWIEVAAGGGCTGVQGQRAGGRGSGRCCKVFAWAILRASGCVESAVGALHDYLELVRDTCARECCRLAQARLQDVRVLDVTGHGW